jgi:hypothetical protein
MDSVKTMVGVPVFSNILNLKETRLLGAQFGKSFELFQIV